MTVWVGGSLALVVVPTVLVRTVHASIGLCVAGCLITPFLLFFSPTLCTERGFEPVRSGPDNMILTARTWTGSRSVDLAQLVSVRYLHLRTDRAKRDVFDMLLVKDRHGVRLGVTSAAGFRAVLDAVLVYEDGDAPQGPGGPLVSHGARAALGLEPESAWRDGLFYSCALVGTLALFFLCALVVGLFVAART